MHALLHEIQTSCRQGFYQVLAKGGFHLVVIADGRGDQIEFEDSFHLGIGSRVAPTYDICSELIELNAE
jgi:hypothetical protein